MATLTTATVYQLSLSEHEASFLLTLLGAVSVDEEKTDRGDEYGNTLIAIFDALNLARGLSRDGDIVFSLG